MKILSKLTISTAVSALAAVLALPASADGTTAVVADRVSGSSSMVVELSDLDLGSPAGQQALQYRLAHAAQQVCGHSDVRRAGSVARAARNGACYEQSLSRALSEVNSATLASTY